MKDKYKKENLSKTVSKSESIRNLCRNLGMAETGRNFYTVKKYINLHDISTDHFMTKEEQLHSIKEKNTIPLDKILVENSTYSNNFHLKKKLVRENLLEYKCDRCDNTGEWQGEKLTLQLDHINGVNNDNRIENLRFLCPNCHTQTKTFGFKKRN